MHPEQHSEFMSSREVCTWLGVTRDWLYDRIREDQLPHFKVGRLLKFKHAEVSAWVEEHRR